MKLTTKNILTNTDVVTVTLTQDEWAHYLTINEDAEEVLHYIAEECDLDCSPNHNEWSGYAGDEDAEFNLISECDGDHWVLEVLKEEDAQNNRENDKFKFVDDLGTLFAQYNINEISHMAYNDLTDLVTITYKGGYTKTVNVACNSLTAIVHDLVYQKGV